MPCGRRSGRVFPSRLHEKKYYHSYDDDQEQENDFPLRGLLLVSCRLHFRELRVSGVLGSRNTYHYQFFVCSLDIHGHAFYVVVYSVEHGALVYHHGLQIFEYVCQLDDTLCDVGDFSLSLHDRCVIVVHAFLRGLLQCGLGEGLVGLGFHH